MPADGMCAARKNEFLKGGARLAPIGSSTEKSTPSPARHQWSNAPATVYFEEEPGSRAAVKLLTRDEAQSQTSPKLPELLRKVHELWPNDPPGFSRHS